MVVDPNVQSLDPNVHSVDPNVHSVDPNVTLSMHMFFLIRGLNL